MRFLFLLLLGVSLKGFALDLYDGPTGATCTAYNAGAQIAWRGPGSDWIDANGVRNGTAPFASTRYVRDQIGILQADVTGLGRSLTLRKSGTLSLASRESGNGPRLRLTAADGTVTVLSPSADSTISCTTSRSLGTLAVMAYQTDIIEFPPLPEHVSAVLELPIVRSYSAGTLGIYKLLKPEQAAVVSRGYLDGVLYSEGWDVEPKDWYKRAGYAYGKPYAWEDRGSGVMFPPECRGTFYAPGEGWQGSAGLRLQYFADGIINHQGTCVPTINFVQRGIGEQEHLYFRYYLKLGQDWRDFPICDGGKFPGFSGNTLIAGNAGDPVNGYNGWSARSGYAMNCDAANPAYPRVAYHWYVYHPGQGGWYGDHWYVGELGLMELGKWYCVEGEVKVNTPGERDGVMRYWLDGALVFEKLDVLLRGERPDPGYGDWRPLPLETTTTAPTFHDELNNREMYLAGPILPGSILGIERFHGSFFHGGKRAAFKTATAWYDETVIARDRIGCTVR